MRRPGHFLSPMTTVANDALRTTVPPHPMSIPHRRHFDDATAALPLPPIIQPQYLVTTTPHSHQDYDHNRTGRKTLHGSLSTLCLCVVAIITRRCGLGLTENAGLGNNCLICMQRQLIVKTTNLLDCNFIVRSLYEDSSY